MLLIPGSYNSALMTIWPSKMRKENNSIAIRHNNYICDILIKEIILYSLFYIILHYYLIFYGGERLVKSLSSKYVLFRADVK